MQYLKHYILLMRKAEKRVVPDGYTESHHIFPKSVYGENNRIVSLTAREHYIAHALLDKGFRQRYGLQSKRTQQMINAHMGMNGKGRGREVYINSYIYEGMKKYMSEMMRGNTQSKGNRYSLTEEQKDAKRRRKWYNNGTKEIHSLEKPDGWKSGRLPMNSVNGKQWRLIFDDGCAIIVESLRKWCIENNINYIYLFRAHQQQKPYKHIKEVIKC